MQKDVLGFYALLFCEYSTEMASRHGCHSNVNSYLSYLSNAGRNCMAKALSSGVLCKQVLPLKVLGSFAEEMEPPLFPQPTAYLCLSLNFSALLSICHLPSFYFYYHLSSSLIHGYFIFPDSTTLFQCHYCKLCLYFRSPQNCDNRMTSKK